MSGGLKTLRAGGLGGFRNTLRAFAAEHRSMTIIGGMALVAAVLPILAIVPPLSVFQGQCVWVNGFANAGVFVLLAIGLNIVVGLAGLLDLGYAAFFAIGAYTYAYAASPY
jgi:branched-chain amino acid transport system permease protein